VSRTVIGAVALSILVTALTVLDGKVIVREGETFSDIIGGPPNICSVDGIYYPPAS
jgi:hypothetical protein